jgi:peptide/nickel transport system permease protein
VVNFVRQKHLGAFGLAVAIVLIIAAIFAPWIATHDPFEPSFQNQFGQPGLEHWLGGDHLGRDLFSRLVYGARISLYAGLLSSFIGVTIGVMVGVISVHFGGKTDLGIQRVIDTMQAFPTFILAIAIMASLGASLNNVVIALSIAFIPSPARVIRSQAMAIKEMDYVLAAQAVGAGALRIMLRHMMPNLVSLYLVMVTYYLGSAIIAEAGLSFLGVGTPPDVPSWGGILNRAAANTTIAPWMTVVPGLAIFIVVFAWNVLGDALRDVLDPKLRGTGSG